MMYTLYFVDMLLYESNVKMYKQYTLHTVCTQSHTTYRLVDDDV